jgi:hypothetical protein
MYYWSPGRRKKRLAGNWHAPFAYWHGLAGDAPGEARRPLFWLLAQMVPGLGRYCVCLLAGLLVTLTGTGLGVAPIPWDEWFPALRTQDEIREATRRATPLVEPPEPEISKNLQQAQNQVEAILPSMKPLAEEPSPAPDAPIARGMRVGGFSLNIATDDRQHLPQVVEKLGALAYVTPLVDEKGERRYEYTDKVFQFAGGEWKKVADLWTTANFFCARLDHPERWELVRGLMAGQPLKPGQEVWLMLRSEFVDMIFSRALTQARSRQLARVQSAEIRLTVEDPQGFVLLDVN